MRSAALANRPLAGREPGDRHVSVIQGEFQVTDDPAVVLTTLLGSCVAACIHDPVARVGGLNHFLLPSGEGRPGADHLRYGVHSMELLVNGLLKLGGRRDRLQVWLFGGARITRQLADIGASNAAFAEDFVRREEFTYKGGSLRGDTARRIQFWPASGRVRQLALPNTPVEVLPVAPPRAPAPATDDPEFF